MVAIIDYGVGNLFSLRSSLERIGAQVMVTDDVEILRSADRLILPGVGAFADAKRLLSESGIDKVIVDEVGKGKAILGICLGMQMLFEESHEYGVHKGLSLLKGKVVPMKGVIPENYQIPHIGWNALDIKREHPLFRYIKNGDHVYFVHSYYASGCEDSLIATAEYGAALTAAVAKGNICGTQFHPEKSGETGLAILRAFAEMETAE
jgi:glutamine amidotransferase